MLGSGRLVVIEIYCRNMTYIYQCMYVEMGNICMIGAAACLGVGTVD